ncbi:MAG: FAD-dependent oxidoreductase, partial [Rhodobacteraceae bacterium]|nr:FAD-dependent oxidoreductase [Paracoccaceae bacterium]
MKVIVLGAGVIGVTAAYALGQAGHNVTVIDRAREVASQTSHANGAQLAYSYAEPFACPTTLRKLPGYFMSKDIGIGMRLNMNPSLYRWGFEFIKNCTPSKETENLHAMLALAAQSKAAMQTLTAELDIGIIDCGKLILAKTEKDLEGYGKLENVKRKYGLNVNMLDKEACLELEPALAGWQGAFYGGLYARGDNVLDPVRFCKALQTAAHKKYGVGFEFGHEILG